MNGFKTMDKRSEFIIAAIQDCQATIRATDVKVGALLAGLLLPFSQINQIWMHFKQLSVLINCQAITYVFFFLWFLSIFLLVRTIAAIDNPTNHIVNSGNCTGSFYSGGLYTFGILDSILNRDLVKANKDISTFNANYPSNLNEIELELSFEHMKLIYIREIKLNRLKFSLRTSSICLIVGVCVFLYLKHSI